MTSLSAVTTIAALAGVQACTRPLGHEGVSRRPGADRHVRITGEATVQGSEGSFALSVDSEGRFCYVAATPIPEGAGYDGKRGWAMEASGVPRRVWDHELETLRARWRSWASRSAGGAPRPTQRDTLPGPAGTREVVTLEDFVEVGGLTIPMRSAAVAEGLEVRRLLVREHEIIEGPLSCDPPAAHEADLDSAIAPEIEVRRAPTGHLLIRPEIDGRDVGWFILDTGAGAGTGVISLDLARRLELSAVGTAALTAADGTVPAPWYFVDRLTLGPMSVLNAPLVGMDLDFLETPLGAPIAGVVGYGVFARAVVAVAPDGTGLRMFSPEDHPFERASWQPLKLVDLIPVAHASTSFASGRFRLDLGAGGGAGGVIFHSPTVQREDLLKVAGSPVPSEGPAAAATLPWIDFGGRRFERVPALLWTSDRGAFAEPDLVGTIGLTLLSRFSLILDYARDRYSLVPAESP